MQVAVFGMGLMGEPMVLNLANNGVEVMAYNRSPEKLASLDKQGIPVTQNPQEAIAFADVLIFMLTNYQAIVEVLFTNIDSLEGKTVIQMATIAPDESRKLLTEIKSKGGEYLEAPVLGSIPEVKTGKLLVMVGATENQFQQWQNLLQNFGSQPLLVGEVGQAAALKLALNQMIAGLTSTFALSLSFLQQQGVDLDTFMTILRDSALYASTFDKKLSRMCEGNFANPNFPTKHLLKDINLFLTSAQTIGLNTKALEGIEAIVSQTVRDNLADSDYSAVIEAIKSPQKS
jgi:3-hydroxyisobutyrate dehydrogenase